MGKILKVGWWVPNASLERNITQWFNACTSPPLVIDGKVLMAYIVAGDEKWVYYDIPEGERSCVGPGQAIALTQKINTHNKKSYYLQVMGL